MTAGGPLVLERSNIWRNASNLGWGIALLDHSTDTSLMRNNLFQDNIAGTDGGALYMTGTVARALIGNNTLTGNDSDNGGAMYIDAPDAAQLYLWSNLLLRNGGDFAIYNFPTNGASDAYNLLCFPWWCAFLLRE